MRRESEMISGEIVEMTVFVICQLLRVYEVIVTSSQKILSRVVRDC